MRSHLFRRSFLALLAISGLLSTLAPRAKATPGPGDPPEITRSTTTITITIPPDWAQPKK